MRRTLLVIVACCLLAASALASEASTRPFGVIIQASGAPVAGTDFCVTITPTQGEGGGLGVLVELNGVEVGRVTRTVDAATGVITLCFPIAGGGQGGSLSITVSGTGSFSQATMVVG